ncbi:39S ribosomal protein L32, mitochondrial-like [Penaeus japonicus]|uniref:39S ribosomal protein L32, mitochondrial-like n=1 Tax=Penaeus japonicus TaxID=27405 RepID=UPI001C715F01|nr:39S ribosomal protein L32, mitochondrial-like [Penaeus japonicus]
MSRILRLLQDNFSLAERTFDRLISSLFPHGPPPSVAMVCLEHTPHQPTNAVRQSPIQDLIGDGILWAVPKSRRSRERRLTRKFGSETGHKKLLPVLNLLTCNSCGHVHEPGRLCPNCYGKVKEVTEAMQNAMNSTQGLKPVEHEVFPVFKGEKINTEDGFFEGKRIVEVDRERPKWFSQRLTQKSNATTSSDTSIAKPTHLA